MAVYTYRAIDREAVVRSGRLPARSEAELENRLSLQGLTLIEAGRAGFVDWRGLAGPRFGEGDLLDFTYLLRLITSSGISLLEGLADVAAGYGNRRIQEVFACLRDGVESGKSLSGVMLERPEVFPSYYVQMVRAGEISGTVDRSLASLMEYLEWQTELKKTIRSYLVYPSVVLAVLGLLAVILFTFVFPRLFKILTGLKTGIPLATRIVLGLSGFVHDHFLVLAAGLTLLVVGGRLWVRSPAGRLVFHALLLRTPFIGGLVRKINLSRYFKTLATLHSVGLDIQQTCNTGVEVVNNVALRHRLRRVTEAVLGGATISGSLAATGEVQKLVVDMITLGEKTGNLDQALFRVCDIYDKEVPEAIKKVFAVVEPMIILLMGLMALVVLLAVFLPIYGIVGSIRVR